MLKPQGLGQRGLSHGSFLFIRVYTGLTRPWKLNATHYFTEAEAQVVLFGGSNGAVPQEFGNQRKGVSHGEELMYHRMTGCMGMTVTTVETCGLADPVEDVSGLAGGEREHPRIIVPITHAIQSQ